MVTKASGNFGLTNSVKRVIHIFFHSGNVYFSQPGTTLVQCLLQYFKKFRGKINVRIVWLTDASGAAVRPVSVRRRQSGIGMRRSRCYVLWCSWFNSTRPSSAVSSIFFLTICGSHWIVAAWQDPVRHSHWKSRPCVPRSSSISWPAWHTLAQTAQTLIAAVGWSVKDITKRIATW